MLRHFGDYALSSYSIPLEIELEIDFVSLGCRAKTLSTEEIILQWGLLDQQRNHTTRAKEAIDHSLKWLSIEIESKLDPFDSLNEAGRYSRPRLMAILGVISFLTDNPFLPFESTMGSKTVMTKPILLENEPSVSTFITKGENKSNDLKCFLQLLISKDLKEKNLVSSALDRFRRGLHFEKMTEDEPLYDEEAFLAYFHTLELLSFDEQESQKETAKQQLHEFMDEFLKKPLMYSERSFLEKSRERKQQVEALLIDEGDFSISSAIKYFFDKYNLLTPDVADTVDKLVKIRNSIAHASHIYCDDLVWPVPQFFPLHKDTFDYLFIVKIMAAKAISARAKVDAWSSEWNQFINSLLPSPKRIQEFLKNKEYNNIDVKEFVTGTLDGIKPSIITYSFLEGAISEDLFEESLSSVLISLEITEDFEEEFLGATMLLSDSKNVSLANRCQELIESWDSMVDVRRMYYSLECIVNNSKKFRRFKLCWVKSYLIRKYTE